MTRFLIVTADYPAFVDSLYAGNPGLEGQPYARQLEAYNESLFGVSDCYPRNLGALGHPTVEVHLNNRPLQTAWAREHGIDVSARGRPRLALRRGVLPWLVRERAPWMAAVLRAQIDEFAPDVVLTHSFSDLPPGFWQSLHGRYRLLVGQIASPLADDIDLGPFDLLLSSLPNFVARFRGAGLRAELFRLGFDPIVLERIGEPGSPIDVSFVGSLSSHHSGRTAWLESVCRSVPIQVWGQGTDGLPRDSAIRAAYRGPAWGIDMFRVLKRSRISLNHHIEIAGPYANNMRLYETTGVGAQLLTDAKDNLDELFKPRVETAVYRTPEECIEQIRYYLEHENERARIARAGQERCLRDHTYRQRMAELVAHVEALL